MNSRIWQGHEHIEVVSLQFMFQITYSLKGSTINIKLVSKYNRLLCLPDGFSGSSRGVSMIENWGSGWKIVVECIAKSNGFHVRRYLRCVDLEVGGSGYSIVQWHLRPSKGLIVWILPRGCLWPCAPSLVVGDRILIPWQSGSQVIFWVSCRSMSSQTVAQWFTLFDNLLSLIRGPSRNLYFTSGSAKSYSDSKHSYYH